MSSKTLACIAVFFICLTVRILFSEFAPANYQTFGDTAEYIDTAKSFCSTASYPFEHRVLPAFRAPGFPLLLALISGCFSISIFYTKLILMLLDCLACILGMAVVYKLAKRAQTLRALTFGLIYSTYPFFVQQTVAVQSESFTLFLIMSALYFFVITKFLLSGASIGLAVLTRPSALIFAVPLALGFVISKSSLRKGILLTFLGSSLLISCWSIYATRSTGKLTLVNDSFCYSLYRGTRLELIDVYNANDPETFSLASELSEKAVRDAEKIIPDDGWCKAAIAEISKAPGPQIQLMLYKLWAFFRPWPHQAAHAGWIVEIVGAMVLTLYLVFVWFLFQASGKDHKLRTIKWIVSIYIFLVALFHVPHQVSNRYRIPFVDPVMMLMIASCFRLKKEKDSLDT
jgi:hypothetical protein